MIKDVLRAARMRKNLTQQDVAERIKVAKQTYLKWENGETEPKASQIQKLSETLNISANEICRGEESNKMELQDFIVELSIKDMPREVVIMTTWEMLDDHREFLKELDDFKRR
ncbi:helix-turn-helix domain-containing protein [Vibrio astriarenae]|uniref:Helix-turn-helix domain-containing protein n=1 Tax=Vibrio astriarenae TaxID=1481923 RepID=A0A7Z2YDI2_9VIBR|nr:helix-turn-helix transcriptional regulator [Vibrio astriarenae]QIA63312.1 helix-turn-helix domain-containing protein [Vibrio astriarenae]QIA63317.1 helix-turn-helix domain-containing protein [Vibrio astriarenae]